VTPLVVLPHWWTVDGADPGIWEVIAHGVAHDAHGDLPGWDYQTPLDFVCSVSVDLDVVRADCGLGPGAEVRLAASWHSSTTNRRAVGASVPVPASGEHRLHMRVDPTEVGGHLRINRLLVLGGDADGGEAGAARRAGSVLWYEPNELATIVHLEGEVARFPTEAVDFSGLPIGEPDAAWWLDAHLDDLDASPLHALRLYVNADHPTMERFLGGEESELTDAARSVLLWDVARTLIDAALDDDRFVAGVPPFAPDSIGATLTDLFDRFLPDSDPASLRRLRATDPGRYAYTVQARLGLLGHPEAQP
jgi:hypothetical protein